MVQHRAILTMVDQSEVGSYHWTTPNPHFKVTPVFGAEYLSNGTR